MVKERLDEISVAIKKSLEYYKRINNIKVTEIILVGGTSNIEGIDKFFKKSLDIKTSVGVQGVVKTKKNLIYVKAIGLAMRGIGKKWKDDSVLLPIDLKKFNRVLETEKTKKQEKTDLDSRLVDKEIIENRTEKIRLKYQKLTFFVVIGIGFFLITGLIIFRNSSREDRAQEIESKTKTFRLVQDFMIDVPVVISNNQESLKEGIIAGRIVENIIIEETSFNEAINGSKRRALKQLKDDETLWETPLNEFEKEKIEFPVEFHWLAFSQVDMNKIALDQVIKQIDIVEDEFGLNKIEVLSVEKVENSTDYVMGINVTLSLNVLLE